VTVRALALTERLCWDSLTRGNAAAFTRQAVVWSELHEFGVCGGLLKDLQGRRALVCRPRIPAVYRPERRTSHCFRESPGMPEGTGNVLVCALACGAPGAAVCRLRGC